MTTATELSLTDLGALVLQQWPDGAVYELEDGSVAVVGHLNGSLHAWSGRTPAEAAAEASLIGRQQL